MSVDIPMQETLDDAGHTEPVIDEPFTNFEDGDTTSNIHPVSYDLLDRLPVTPTQTQIIHRLSEQVRSNGGLYNAILICIYVVREGAGEFIRALVEQEEAIVSDLSSQGDIAAIRTASKSIMRMLVYLEDELEDLMQENALSAWAFDDAWEKVLWGFYKSARDGGDTADLIEDIADRYLGDQAVKSLISRVLGPDMTEPPMPEEATDGFNVEAFDEYLRDIDDQDEWLEERENMRRDRVISFLAQLLLDGYERFFMKLEILVDELSIGRAAINRPALNEAVNILRDRLRLFSMLPRSRDMGTRREIEERLLRAYNTVGSNRENVQFIMSLFQESIPAQLLINKILSDNTPES